jgi:hypothetical protein
MVTVHKQDIDVEEIDAIINELERNGINEGTQAREIQTRGLGDVVEATLQKFGITQERYKEWFGLAECNCTKRKQFLNGVLSWGVNKEIYKKE